MEQKPITVNNTPVSLEGLTFLVLLVLKLTKQADLDWWLVLLPIYIGPVTLFTLGVIVLAVTTAITKVKISRLKKRQDEWTKQMDKGEKNE